ncbi:MAG: GxxExxY protein [Bacteroidota bacterium]
MKNESLTYRIIGAAHQVHNTLGSGFLEKVYENALLIELEKRGLKAQQQYPVSVYYEDQKVGDYYADLLVEEQIVIELKAVEHLIDIHEVQLVNYLKGTGLDIGLLINFGSSVQIKRKYREYHKPPS